MDFSLMERFGEKVWSCCSTPYSVGQKSCPYCDPELDVVHSKAGIRCKCPWDCQCHNKPKTYEVKLTRRTVDNWLREFTQDGDTLTVHAMRSGNGLIIQNQRTLVCYILKDPNG